MRITKINIPESKKETGLEAIKMEKLGKVVLLAGKNGAGKSRILDYIGRNFSQKLTTSNIRSIENSIKSYEDSIQNIKSEIKNYELNIFNRSYSATGLLNVNNEIKNLNNSILSNKKEIENLSNQLNNEKIETTQLSERYDMFAFVPKNLNLKDCNSLPKNILESNAKNISAVGVDALPDGVFAKIQHIQNIYFNATHQNLNVDEETKTKAINDYEKLKELIKLFLNTDLERDIEANATLFGFQLGKTQLSDGQKILVQFCLAIYSQETSLKELILILDEPENHLHPSVIVETIDKIIHCIPDGQIWIATHSIPLLAHFDPSLIWFVENGKVRHAGKIPERVLESLLGNENEISKLQDFINLPAQYASNRYAFECLLEPSVVDTNVNDPQSRQIRKGLLSISKTGSIKVLDYGAGKGRSISNIFDLDQDNQEKLIKNLDYIAYDEYDHDKKICENVLNKVYGSESKNRYFNNMTKLLSKHDKESFDVIIMCNVLHEIDPKDWLSLFVESGTLSQLLKDNGVLLLVEDNLIPIGEKAYQKGFLVLDTPELKDLFKISSSDKNFIIDDFSETGRLKSHQIPKKYLTQITSETRLKAIKSLKKKAVTEILKIRKEEKSYKNGKLHGFWTQQLANAELNIGELST